MSRQLLLCLLLLSFIAPEISAAGSAAAEEETKIDLMPKIHGAFRARWEYDTPNDRNRFEVRNARVTLNGMIAPTIDYFFQTDLCDQGKMKILDAWGRIAITDGLKFQAGQFRLPFGTDCFRAPANYVFANRSFVGGTLNNIRGVGAKLSYTLPLPESSSLLIEGGAFNRTAMADHTIWNSDMVFAGKAVYTYDHIKIAAGAETIIPDSVRINAFSGSVTWTCGGWTVEGEYLNKHFVHRSSRTGHGYNFFVDYGFPVKAGVFNRASVQGRFDGMTKQSSGIYNTAHVLPLNLEARNRITVGGTLTYAYKAVHCDVRLNYEKYFYHEGVVPAVGADDKICAEMVIRF
ncbi:MAG: hypothetical protein NC212_06465 [Staphylococcus sp.]|nr:hypothetical protein [Staphylococcus sp.]